MNDKKIDFDIPYEPYKIQRDFMIDLYNTLENGGIGIFQSPTGTGKSLSLICGAFKWLSEFEKNRRTIINFTSSVQGNDEDDPDWLKSQLEEIEKGKFTEEEQERQQILKDIDFHADMGRDSKSFDQSKRHLECESTKFLCKGEERKRKIYENKTLDSDYFSKIQNQITKIYYCSRTHSQLSQFVDQIKKTKYKLNLRTCLLASRKILCINPKVNNLKKPQLINDKCKKYRENKKCQFFTVNYQALTDLILSQPMDIEELYSNGKCYQQCPYFASRRASTFSQLITVPYQTIINQDSSKSLKINLKNNILIIDEAHNLINIIESTNSFKIYSEELKLLISCFDIFLNHKRENDHHAYLYISQLKMICESLVILCSVTQILNPFEFLNLYNLENVNFYKLHTYCSDNIIANKFYKTFFKIHGSKDPSSVISFFQIIYWICSSQCDDKILSCCNKSKSYLKFLCIDSTSRFKKITADCRAMIIVGGTLDPVCEIIDFLAQSGFNKKKINFYNYDHIVSEKNILTLIIKSGPTNQEISWSFNNREDENIIKTISISFYNIYSLIPNGVVCFFPSYKMLDIFVNYLKISSLFGKINENKKIFIENKNENSNSIFAKYEQKIKKNQGAILLAVMNGKLSEGINFSDDLCRGIIIFGMPYGNRNDCEFKLKIDYYAKSHDEKSTQDHYHNLCMSIVNQSIGRAIRHKQDYAAIFLIDARYSRNHIRSKLPSWITRNVEDIDVFGSSIPKIIQFFKKFKKN